MTVDLIYGGAVFAVLGSIFSMVVWGFWKDQVAKEMKGTGTGIDQKTAMVWQAVYLFLFGAVFVWIMQLTWTVLPGIGYMKGVYLGGALWVLYLFHGLIMKIYVKAGQTTFMADMLNWLLTYVIGAVAIFYLLF